MMARAEGTARAAKMRKLREQGLSWAEIGERYGITGQAVVRCCGATASAAQCPPMVATGR